MNVYQKFKGFGNIVLDLDACAFSLEHERAVHCIHGRRADSPRLCAQKETLKRIVRPQQKFLPMIRMAQGLGGDRVFKSQH